MRRGALAGVLLLGAALRFHGLGSESLWLDEGFTLGMARQTLKENIRETPNDVHSVPYFQIVRSSVRLLGESEESLRLPSAVAGSLLPLVVFLLAGEIFPPAAALPAALVAGLASYQIRYSQEARQYSLLALLATLSMLAFVRLVRGGARGGPGVGRVAAYAAVTLLLLSIHHHAVFVIAGQMLVVVLAGGSLGRAGRRGFAAACLLMLPFLAGWVLLSVRQFHSIGGFATVERTSLSAIGKTAKLLVVPDFERSYMESWVLTPLVVVAFLPAALRRLRRHPRGEGARECPSPILLAGAWIFASLVLPVAVSWLGFPVFRKRYAISAGVPLYLLLGWGLSAYGPRRRPWALAAVAVLLLGSHLAARAEGPRKEDWRSAGVFLAERTSRCDQIIVDAREYHTVLGFYLPADLRARLGPAPTGSTPGACLVLGPIRSVRAAVAPGGPSVQGGAGDGIERATFRGPIDVSLPS